MLVVVYAGVTPVEIHRLGCADIARKYGRRWAAKRGAEYQYSTVKEAIDAYLHDPDGPEDNPGFDWGDIKVYPCTT